MDHEIFITPDELKLYGYCLGRFDNGTFLSFEQRAEALFATAVLAVDLRPNHGSKNQGVAMLFDEVLWRKMLGRMHLHAASIPEVYALYNSGFKIQKCGKDCTLCDLSCLI